MVGVSLTPKALGAAAVIRDAEGRVLLVKHSYGRLNWELPGGGADAGESVARTAEREVLEETGLRVQAERLTGVYHDPRHESGLDFHHFVFVCRPLDEDASPRPASPEITDCAYWPPEALPRPISDFTAWRIRDAVSGIPPLLPVEIGPRRWLE